MYADLLIFVAQDWFNIKFLFFLSCQIIQTGAACTFIALCKSLDHPLFFCIVLPVFSLFIEPNSK